MTIQNDLNGHMTFIQRRLDVDVTSMRCIDVEATLHKRYVTAGRRYIDVEL